MAKYQPWRILVYIRDRKKWWERSWQGFDTQWEAEAYVNAHSHKDLLMVSHHRAVNTVLLFLNNGDNHG